MKNEIELLGNVIEIFKKNISNIAVASILFLSVIVILYFSFNEIISSSSVNINNDYEKIIPAKLGDIVLDNSNEQNNNKYDVVEVGNINIYDVNIPSIPETLQISNCKIINAKNNETFGVDRQLFKELGVDAHKLEKFYRDSGK